MVGVRVERLYWYARRELPTQMTDEDEDDLIAEEYETSASDRRDRAAQMRDGDVRELMLRIADDYDVMARSARDIAKTKRTIERLNILPTQ